MDLRYDSIAALIEAAKQSGRKLSELVLEQQAVQMEQSADELCEIMRKSYAVMAASVEGGESARRTFGQRPFGRRRLPYGTQAEREGNVLCEGCSPARSPARLQSANGTRQWGPYRCGAHGELLRNSAGRRAHVAGRA